ncbi:MAG: methylated-DNA--[protein]-cysteine S-methyltransferase [Chloroflexota bacterium]|jgi:methylated-DNA-[protein]-cysteine S-methyltransferase
MATRLSVFHSDWGWIGMAVSRRGLAGLTLPQASEESAWSHLYSGWPDGVPQESSVWPELQMRLLDYLAGKPVSFADIELDLPSGPPFWKRVWQLCAQIPFGETRSYKELALEAGAPQAFRAVGGAMAANPIPIVIPCHRVVGSNGSLVGFGGGVEQKRRLLEMESAAMRGHADAETRG